MSNSLRPHGLCSPWNSPGQSSGVGSLSLFQGIFPTQGLNSGPLHCRQILYQLSHQGRTLPFLSLNICSRYPLHLRSHLLIQSRGSNTVCPARFVSATNSSMKLFFISPTKCGFSLWRSWNASRLYKVHRFWTLCDHRSSYMQLKKSFFLS